MVRIYNKCDCATCDGGKPAKKGVFGGSICTCPCHRSGHPIDSKEHHAWATKQAQSHMKSLIQMHEDRERMKK